MASVRCRTDVGSRRTPGSGGRGQTVEMATQVRKAHSGNRLLAGLPWRDQERIMSKLVPSFLEVETVLFEPGEVVAAVYFPLDGVVSLVTPLQDGAIVEVATVGNEGVVGVPAVLGGSLAVRAISQGAGRSLTMTTSSFLGEVALNEPLARLVQNYVQALFGQISQAAACNRLHSSEERLSRWLLMSRDRVGKDQFPISKEFLGQMLGAPRATVTLAAGVLQKEGLISYRRGLIEIVDGKGLEAVACECYRVIRAEFDGVTAAAGTQPE